MTNRPQYFRLTCLTPVHIGTGVEYVGGIDLVAHNGKTWMLDSERVLEALYANGQLPRDPDGLRSSIAAFLRRAKIEEYAVACGSAVVPDGLRVRAAIRSGDGYPIIPGSSIKGALRSLLFAARSCTNGPHGTMRPEFARELAVSAGQARPGSKFAARRLEGLLFRSATRPELDLEPTDAKADLMRMCSVADVAFSADSAQVMLTAAVSTNRNTTTIAAEALAASSAAAVQLTLSSPYMESMFTERLPPWRTLAEWSRRHALHLLKTDVKYFNRPATELFRDCTKIIERLEALRQNIERSDPESLFVRLGWGTGWRTMTADLLNDEQRRRLLPKSTQLGPKTRKVIIADGSRNAPAIDAFGWISLTPISEAEALNARSGVTSSRRRLAPTPAAPESQPSIVYQGDAFLQAVATLQAKDWGRLADFYRRAISDPNLKGSRLAAMGAKVYQIWKGDKRRLREAAEKFPELAGHLHPGTDHRTP